MNRLRMEGTAIPTSLLLLLLWTCCSLASATTRASATLGTDSGEDADCEVFTDKISGTELLLDTHTLQSANGDVQRILDCIPEGGKVLIDIEHVPMNKDLVIRKPVAIHSKRNDGGTKISGAAIKVRADNVTLRGLTIKDYSMSSPEAFIDIQSAQGVVVEDVECSGCENTKGPSCISGASSSVTIRKFTGRKNKGVSGGAAGFEKSTIIIKDSSFEDNASTEFGGALYLESSDLEMEDTIFLRNSAGGNGGGVFAKVGGTTEPAVKVQSSHFVDNFAQHGGGLQINAVSAIRGEFHIINSNFFGNSAENAKAGNGNGGGLHIHAHGSRDCITYVMGGLLTQNKAANEGGALDLNYNDANNAQIRIYNINALNNTASEGAGMYIETENSESCVADVISTLFTKNVATNQGGGARFNALNAINGQINIIKSHFDGNKGAYGGGVSIDGKNSKNCIVDVMGTQLTKNEVKGNGGGASFNVNKATGGQIRIYSSNIDHNTAAYGPGMHFDIKATTNTDVMLFLNNFKNGADDGVVFNPTSFKPDTCENTPPFPPTQQASADFFANDPISNPKYLS